MSSSDRKRPKPIPIKDRSEIRGNHSYIIEEPAPVKPERKKGASDGEAV